MPESGRLRQPVRVEVLVSVREVPARRLHTVANMLVSDSDTCYRLARGRNTVPILQRTLCQFVLTFVAMGVSLGCADECEYGQVQCDGNIARTCIVPESHAEWNSKDCGTNTCVVAKQGGSSIAFCALGAAPDSRCSEPDFANCAGSTLVECTAGYATATRTCADGCRALDDYPDRCMGESSPDQQQRCPVDGYQCAMASGLVHDDAAVGSNPVGGTGVCSENLMPGTPGSVVYSQRCEGGSIVARTRCAQGCAVLADCSTSCL